MAEITLLDGGMGQELVKRASGKPGPLWGVAVMIDRPETVREVHDAYFAAGAEIATANTYNLHRDRLAPFGMEDRFADLHRTACRIACDARDRAAASGRARGRVAGALGPLRASYRPDLAPPVDEAAALFAEIVRLQAPYVDLFIIETMSSVAEAAGAMAGARAAAGGRPVWLSVSVADEDGTRLRSGEPVDAILPLVAETRPEALLVNCSIPEAVGAALPSLAGAGVPLGAYANGFTRITEDFLAPQPTVDALTARADLGPDAYADFAEGWVEAGATIVGGCCEVGPDHVAELARRLKAA